MRNAPKRRDVLRAMLIHDNPVLPARIEEILREEGNPQGFGSITAVLSLAVKVGVAKTELIEGKTHYALSEKYFRKNANKKKIFLFEDALGAMSIVGKHEKRKKSPEPKDTLKPSHCEKVHVTLQLPSGKALVMNLDDARFLRDVLHSALA